MQRADNRERTLPGALDHAHARNAKARPQLNSPQPAHSPPKEPGIAAAADDRDHHHDLRRYLPIVIGATFLLLVIAASLVLNRSDTTDAHLQVVDAQANDDSDDNPSPASDQIGDTAASGSDAANAPTASPDCTINEYLKDGSSGESVLCLESRLQSTGQFSGAPDTIFDGATTAAVKAFQEANDLGTDGVVGPLTSEKLGAWIGPDGDTPDASTCPGSGRAAVVDRFNQRTWLCDDGAITKVLPVTTATDQPAPGTYEVYGKDIDASSNLTGQYSEMTHFVAFTKGIYSGARIAFHSVPTYGDGSYVQPLESVGTTEVFGDSSGCIRVLPDDAQLIWDWLDIGATVTVVS